MQAIEYYLKRLYESAEDDLLAYHAHVNAVEEAFDLHPEQLFDCMQRASNARINTGPFCWKHVDVSHGIVLEDVEVGTPLMTHKPVVIIDGLLNDEIMLHYAQVFYLSMVKWPIEQLASICKLYNNSILKHAETPEAYALVASMAITWADILTENVVLQPAEWDTRFQVFGLLATKCIPCPHVCGRVMVMGPDYFEQVDDILVPNAGITPHTWSLPFGQVSFNRDECNGHCMNQVTYASVPIKAGEFIRVTLNNPLVDHQHPSHFQHPDGASMCRQLLCMGAMALTPEQVKTKLPELTLVVSQHEQSKHDQIASPTLWPSEYSSVAMASATSLCCIIQQAPLDAPETKAAVTALHKFLSKMKFPTACWYFGMWHEIHTKRYEHSVFDVLRSLLRSMMEKRWANLDSIKTKLDLVTYN